MHIRLKGVTALAATAAAALWLAPIPTAGQTPSADFPPYKAPRIADGKPNLNGIWQSFTTANWDILAHAAQPGPHPELLGAWGDTSRLGEAVSPLADFLGVEPPALPS